jgi:hypothetical protein
LYVSLELRDGVGGQIEQSMRFGPGRLELVDGSVFECVFSATLDIRLEEQHGVSAQGKVKINEFSRSGGTRIDSNS